MTTGSLSASEPRTVEQNCLVLDCTSSGSCLHAVDTRLKVAALTCGWSLVGFDDGTHNAMSSLVPRPHLVRISLPV